MNTEGRSALARQVVELRARWRRRYRGDAAFRRQLLSQLRFAVRAEADALRIKGPVHRAPSRTPIEAARYDCGK